MAFNSRGSFRIFVLIAATAGCACAACFIAYTVIGVYAASNGLSLDPSFLIPIGYVSAGIAAVFAICAFITRSRLR